MKKIIAGLLILSPILLTACGGEEKKTVSVQETAKDAAIEKGRAEIDKLNEEYPRVPDEKFLDEEVVNSPVYEELKQRYKENLATLKQEVEATGAKLVVVIMTPETGKNMPNQVKKGVPFITGTCKELGLELHDMSPLIASQDPKVITQVPKDGHWSKKGAEMIANYLAPIIKKYSTHKATATFKDTERPETFGDLTPNDDQVLDGGKDLPYHLKANAQGLRMDADVKFPKTKQHILFLGGSQIYSPFLDNEFIATALLQKQFPETVIMNSGMMAASIDDYLSLFREKAKYSEPDLVILQTNGGDVTDFFFSNRNHVARSPKPHHPSDLEAKFYQEKIANGVTE
ncbi:MAG: hypothetical protein V4649_10105 [Bacteroidota bacterium]